MFNENIKETFINNISTKNISESQNEYIRNRSDTEFIYIDPLDRTADIELAEQHSKAQRIYKIKYNELTIDKIESMNFCNCCGLPVPHQNLVELFSIDTDISKLGEINIEIYLYFLFIRFLCICLFVLILMILIFQIRNNNYVMNICKNEKEKTNEKCKHFYSNNRFNLNYTLDVINIIYFLRNMIYFQLIYSDHYPDDPSEIIHFPKIFMFIYFFIILIINYIYLIIVKSAVHNNNLGHIEINDFYIMISNIPFKNENELMIELSEVQYF